VIKNERQYRITKSQADRFSEAFELAQAPRPGAPAEHPLLQKAKLDALKSQLADLRAEIREYDLLRSGAYRIVEVDSFGELPVALIKARIASGLSQKDLADRLDMKEQQIQRYEATDYAGASFSRLAEVVKALGVSVREDIFVPSEGLSLKDLLTRLEGFGLDRRLAVSRLMPQDLTPAKVSSAGAEIAGAIFPMASALRRVFGWSMAEILGPGQPQLNFAVAGAARFKLPAKADNTRLAAYTIYAHHLACLTLESTPELVARPIPRDPAEVWRDIRERFGRIDLRAALEYAWGLGVVILPLDDAGAFHGACWRVKGRNVVVLKQQTKSEARWLFDLFHELWHAGEEPELEERTILEASESDPERREAPEEKKASRYAGDIVLDRRAEKLVAMIVAETGGDIPKFKNAVPRIARREGVSTESLANYVAFRLSLQGENWWGTANNLQTPGDPWAIARDFLLSRCDLSRLDRIDQSLLTRALEVRNEVTA
jgi:transcriptional regulator with XRE-family HTH domain/Zn-dependent peptidase ImmA (M78 family)